MRDREAVSIKKTTENKIHHPDKQIHAFESIHRVQNGTKKASKVGNYFVIFIYVSNIFTITILNNY